MAFYGKYTGMGGAAGGGGVTSLDGLTGALTLVAGTGISILDGVSTITISSTSAGDVTIGAFGSTPNNNGLSINGSQVLNMQPADATHPGGVSILAQTLAGIKTFSSLLNADGGIDRSTSGTLTIGATNSTTINIGNSGATVNIQGTTIYENTPQLLVADPLITINSGGGAGSGQNSGIQVEENAIITGYAETSADRNSWILKAPNTAGIATITPGASGITLDQSSHNPVTIGTANGLSLATQVLSLALSSTSTTGALSSTDWNTFNGKQQAITLAAVGATPNANGASLSAGTLNLQAADGTNPGALTAIAQTIGGIKTFSSVPVASGVTSTGTLTLTAQASSNIALNTSGAAIIIANRPIATGTQSTTLGAQLESQATTEQLRLRFNSTTRAQFAVDTNGLLTITAVGSSPALTLTGGTTTVDNLIDSGLTANTALIANGSKQLASSATTSTELGFVSGVTSAIQTQLNGKQASGNYITALTGDVTASGPGSVAATLATVNSNVGSFGSSTAIPSFTVNAKGLITAASDNVVIAPAGTLTGTTLASNVVTSSLTAVGTITTGTWSGTTIALNKGGTGQTTKAAAFDALSPMTTLGDLIYGGASGTGTRLGIGSTSDILTVSGGVPVWQAPGTLTVTTQTSTYAILGTDDIILVSGGVFTVTLPTAVGRTGKLYRIKKTDASYDNIITIATTSAQTIDGASTKTCNTMNEEWTVASNGSNWYVMAHTYSSEWIAYTPAGETGTNTTFTGFYKREGDSIDVQARASYTGAPTGLTNFFISTPSNLVISTAKLLASDSSMPLGIAEHVDDGNANYVGTVFYRSTNTVGVLRNTVSGANIILGGVISTTSPFTIGNLDSTTVRFKVPITGWSE